MKTSTEIAWDAPAPFTLDVVVSPAHIDLMQHTNNVVYLQWLEDVAWAHSRQLGLGPAEYTALGHGMVVREHALHYLRPTHLGQRLTLATWITGIDRLSLRRRYQFVRADDGLTVFRGSTHFVCVEIGSGQVRRMPAAFQRVYSAAVSAFGDPPATA